MDDCTSKTGGLFCDGNFVDTETNSVDDCVAAANKIVTTQIKPIKVTVTTSGSTTCDGGTCTTTDTTTTKASCSASPSRSTGGPLAALGAMLAVVGVVAHRRAKR
jgi:hypothetical protein